MRGTDLIRTAAGAARLQQPQFRQVQGLQRQPPRLLVQVQADWVLSVLVMVFLLGLPSGESGYSFRTVVRSQA
jgi:hypothetical protein